MSINPEEFDLSAKRAHAENTEIGYRNCISRSYYGMYHTVLNVLCYMPNPENFSVHQALFRYLASPAPEEKHDKIVLRKISYILKQAKESRCLADYELTIDDITENSSNLALIQSTKIKEFCDNLCS